MLVERVSILLPNEVFGFAFKLGKEPFLQYFHRNHSSYGSYYKKNVLFARPRDGARKLLILANLFYIVQVPVVRNEQYHRRMFLPHARSQSNIIRNERWIEITDSLLSICKTQNGLRSGIAIYSTQSYKRENYKATIVHAHT